MGKRFFHVDLTKLDLTTILWLIVSIWLADMGKGWSDFSCFGSLSASFHSWMNNGGSSSWSYEQLVASDNVKKMLHVFVGWMAALNAYNNLPYDSSEGQLCIQKDHRGGNLCFRISWCYKLEVYLPLGCRTFQVNFDLQYRVQVSVRCLIISFKCQNFSKLGLFRCVCIVMVRHLLRVIINPDKLLV